MPIRAFFVEKGNSMLGIKFNKEQKYFLKTIKKPIIKRVKIDRPWIAIITISAFIISLLMALFAEITIPRFGLLMGIIILFLFIMLGIIFDIIGVAVMVADIEQFHSMAAKKISGAKHGIKMIQNRERVANFCNDVVGDVCGIISGSAALVVAEYITLNFGMPRVLVVTLITAIVGSLIIGGKALGKNFATNLSNFIIYKVASISALFYKIK